MGKTELLMELGECYRGDWSFFDGRTLQAQLKNWIDLPDTNKAIKDFRKINEMCPLGEGHWTEYCGTYHGEAPTAGNKNG